MHVLSSIALPFFHVGSVGAIQGFGVIVAAGVLIGAAILRRYGEWHGISDDHIRGLLGWVTICGFIGAHEFDMIFYNWDKLGDATVIHPEHWWWPGFLPDWLWFGNWPLPIRFWEGISSYGGFVGGAGGFAFYVWWKRLPVRLFADTTIVGLLPAFTIGRIGCTVVSDHIGAAVDPHKWYAFLAMDYPRNEGLGPINRLIEINPNVLHDGYVTAWNLGLIEFLYLVPVNLLVMWLAFRPNKRPNAGLIPALTGVFYAPVRFFLDYLRPEETDPRHLGLTFAQWISIVAFGAALYVLRRVMVNGAPAEIVAPTSGEAQRRLKIMLREVDEKAKEEPVKATKPAPKADAEPDDDDDDDEDDGDEEAAPAKPAGKSQPNKPAAQRSRGGSSSKKKKRRR